MKFSEAIRALRRQLRLTQPQFAKKLGLSAPSIAHYEIGKRKPDAESTARLCRAAMFSGESPNKRIAY